MTIDHDRVRVGREVGFAGGHTHNLRAYKDNRLHSKQRELNQYI